MAIAQLEIQPVLIEQVENRLIDAIVDGQLLAGQRLTQESVAAMLGVSRQPVSHALQALKRRGLVLEHGKRGLAVAPIDGQRIRDLYQVRAALDGLAAELAADRVRAGQADGAALAVCSQALIRGRSLAKSASMRDRVGCDVTFHSLLYQLSGNIALGQTVAAQWPHFMRSMALVLVDAQTRVRVWDEHAAILDAILTKQPGKAADLARSHTARAGEATARRLELSAVQAPTGT